MSDQIEYIVMRKESEVGIHFANKGELIRCKDCKHQTVSFHPDKRRKDGGIHIYGCDLVDGYTPCGFDEDYCSAAERK